MAVIVAGDKASGRGRICSPRGPLSTQMREFSLVSDNESRSARQHLCQDALKGRVVGELR